MTRIFHSRVYGAINKRRRRALGLVGFKREHVWNLMALEEVHLRARAAAAAYRMLPCWRRALIRISRLWPMLVRFLLSRRPVWKLFGRRPRGNQRG